MHPSEFTDEARRLVAQMTLREKAGFCSGSDFWHLKSLERLGLGRIMVSDGPHGLRKQAETSDHLGMGAAVPATCFPAAGTLACAWDPELCREMGGALAKECAAEGVAVILGPGVNIKRNPLCGRNFEYFSEDPMLAGTLAAAFVAGVQAQGVGCSLKHFAANNQETFRMVVDTRVDERTLRELYLPAFEHVVSEAQPWTVMCGYNRLNGIWCSRPPLAAHPHPHPHNLTLTPSPQPRSRSRARARALTRCSDHRWLLTSVLREQWGFRGLVLSDWAGPRSPPHLPYISAISPL